MSYLQRDLALAVLCGFPLVMPGNRSEGLRNLKVGQDFPAFQLSTPDGKNFTNQDLQGKPAVVVYLSPHQRGSERAVSQASRIVGSFEGKARLVFVTASLGKDDYFKELWKRLGISDALGVDAKRVLYGKLGLVVFPTTMILDKGGKLSHVLTERGTSYGHTLDAYLRHETGEWTKARLVEALKERDPLMRAPKSMASRYRVSARLLWKKGLLESAEKELRKALELSPKEPEIQLDLSQLLLEQKKLDAALDTIESLRKQWPEHKRAQVVHGIVLYKKNEVTKAKQLLLQSLPLNPEPSVIHYYLGLIYEQEGDKDKALEHYRKAARGMLREY